MICVNVEASKNYDVIIGNGILKDVGTYAKKAGLFGKAAIITDDNVKPLYLEKVKTALLDADFCVSEFVIQNGEKSKNAENYIEILNFLSENRFSRGDTVFALGGGVVGDLAGFCAATYMRGMNFVQLPTTLLAAVDSSVGGKTAINLESGKNLVGAFYQPAFVLCDINTLSSLPKLFIEDGMAEIIKYAMIRDSGLAELLMESGDGRMEEIIGRCVKIKRDVVCEDEREAGLRRILNFGHTIGHAIEKASGFSVSHGHAVAAGMHMISSVWEKRGLCEKGTTKKLSDLLLKYNLPLRYDYSPEALFSAAQNDKKLENSGIYIVTLIKTGECETVKIPLSELREIIFEGVEK